MGKEELTKAEKEWLEFVEKYRDLFEKISDEFIQGFAVEPTLNYYCREKRLPVKQVLLENFPSV